MGLQKTIGYRTPRHGFLQRTLHRIGTTRFGAGLFAKTLSPLDRAVHRISGGRTTASASLGGLPLIMLTTIGARSGQTRVNPLTAVPFDGDLALVASNYGSGKTPGWAHNLRANPTASIEYKGQSVSVRSREASAAEADEVFDSAAAIYEGYAAYRERSSANIPVFVLSAVD